ncbi:MAG: DNA-processing protein DprA [Clostridium sp.]|uniref:DNA-processing protein DprA n=1 Tax=Clostridium TaxID=1485 RepID=UPI0018986386|nr:MULTISPECIES: DNA-processing protein DprA [Clostridium]MDU5209328.1 DNA-processing protein DprA [Clostridium sp.]MDU6761528.1 DNA-processing protein DprA [Clostridium sp.]
MNNKNISEDSLAILLLCSNLAINYTVDKVKPFTTVEWSKLAKVILSSPIKKPSNLFNKSKEEIEKELLIDHSKAERIYNLLLKAGQIGFEINNLKNLGINILTRADIVYPKILKEKLKDKCPPVIYYSGDINILNDKLIGVVGSRNIDEYGLEFTKKISEKIVRDNYSLVSGGAKGVDGVAQEEVLKNGGKVVAFIADSLINKIKKKDVREAIIKNKLLILSSINPKSGFTVYSAMDRNKYIYALSEMTVAVSSDYNKGGTWAGATENLKNDWVPLLVRNDSTVPKGNLELIKLGGNKIELSDLNKDFKNLIKERMKTDKAYYEGDLLSFVDNSESKICEENLNNKIIEEENKDEGVNYDIYFLIKNTIKTILKEEMTSEKFCEILNINKTQGNTWLKRAVEEGIVEKLNKPTRYKSV